MRVVRLYGDIESQMMPIELAVAFRTTGKIDSLIRDARRDLKASR